MRGEFVREDGLVLPNNISLAGAQMILQAAFQNQVPSFWAGLVTGFPTPGMTLAQMTEPTVGVNGYARIQILRDASANGWPTVGAIGNESFIASNFLTWTATGSGFDNPIQRVALFGTNAVAPGNVVYALSAPLDDPIIILPTTDLSNRRFKYQIFI